MQLKTNQNNQAPSAVVYTLLCVIQPFLYGAATRLPLVFVGVHAKRVLNASWITIGILIATFQLARACTNAFIGVFGAPAGHITGTLFGFIGYTLIGFSARQVHQLQIFWIGTVLVGLSEVIASMQDYVKREYEDLGLSTLRHNLRTQYAWNVFGTAVGFGFGGYLYKYGGVTSAAQLGIVLEIGELFAAGVYLLNRSANRHFGDEDSYISVYKEDLNGTLLESAFSTGTTSSGGKLRKTNRSLSWSSAAGHGGHAPPTTTTSLSTTSIPEDAKPSWINYALAITFGVQALMIGAILSTGPLFLALTHGVDIEYTGYIFAAGELLGSSILFGILLSANPSNRQRNPCVPEPFNLISMIGFMGLAAMVMSYYDKSAAIVALMLIMGINDCATSATAECQGTTLSVKHYRSMNSLANTLRRMGNTMTAFSGPMMYSMSPHLPFMLFGSLMFMWAILLTYLFHKRAKQLWSSAMVQKLVIQQGSNNDLYNSGRDSQQGGLLLYWKKARFIELECAHHLSMHEMSCDKKEVATTTRLLNHNHQNNLAGNIV